jgi:hypothetical protein
MNRMQPALDDFSGSRNEVSRLYAALYVQFGEIQLPCDIAVIQALTQQAIDGAKDTRLFPKAAHSRPPS